MAGKKDKGASKTNVTGRDKTFKPRQVVKVYEAYKKPNGAIGLRWHWEDAA